MHKYSNISFISLKQNLVKFLSVIYVRSHIFPHTIMYPLFRSTYKF